MKNALIRRVTSLEGDSIFVFYLSESEICLDRRGALYKRGTTVYLLLNYKFNHMNKWSSSPSQTPVYLIFFKGSKYYFNIYVFYQEIFEVK